MKKGQRVNTYRGPGVIVDYEFYARLNGGIKRWGVLLDENPLPSLFDDGVVYFWPDQVDKLPA